MEPHEAVQETSAVAENCNVSFTTMDGSVGKIENAPALPPVPVKETDCGLPPAESVNLRVAVRVPVAAGLNATPAVQLAEAARLVPQVLLEMVKSPASVPEIATLLIVIDEASPLFKVAVPAALVDPTVVVANDRLEGVAVTVPDAEAPE